MVKCWDMEGKIYSVGYQGSNLDNISRILKRHQIDQLIDVRSSPFSKHYSEFNLPYLKKKFGETHKWYGKSLGGFNMTNEKERIAGLSSLIDKVRAGKNICLMCMEADPDKCHRKTDLAKRIKDLFDIKVIHLENKNGDVFPAREPLKDW